MLRVQTRLKPTGFILCQKEKGELRNSFFLYRQFSPTRLRMNKIKTGINLLIAFLILTFVSFIFLFTTHYWIFGILFMIALFFDFATYFRLEYYSLGG